MVGGNPQIWLSLSFTLDREEIVISTMWRSGVFTTRVGTSFVNRTLAFVCIEELADRIEVLIVLMSKDEIVVFPLCCVLLFRLCFADSEVLRQAFQRPFVDGDLRIGATEAWAIQTVVGRFLLGQFCKNLMGRGTGGVKTGAG